MLLPVKFLNATELALLCVQVISAPSLHRIEEYNSFNDAGIPINLSIVSAANVENS
jgi:hypothetical protein